MAKLAHKANGRAVPPETVAICAARKWDALDSDWVLVAEDTLKMSWNDADTKVYIYEKLPPDGKNRKKKKKKPAAY